MFSSCMWTSWQQKHPHNLIHSLWCSLHVCERVDCTVSILLHSLIHTHVRLLRFHHQTLLRDDNAAICIDLIQINWRCRCCLIESAFSLLYDCSHRQALLHDDDAAICLDLDENKWCVCALHYCMIVATVRLSCTMTMRPSASTWSRSIEDADVVWLRVRFYYWREEVMCVRLFIIVFASTWSGSIEDADWECVVWLRVCFMWRCGHA